MVGFTVKGYDYSYQRKDGGKTYCYGNIQPDSNFSICCDDESLDGIAADVDGESLNTWRKVCRYLEKSYNNKSEEITTC